MCREIDYLIRLFSFPLTIEIALQYATAEKWKDLKNLYKKASALWLIAIVTQSKHYYDTLGLEKMKPSIRETLQKLDGIIYEARNGQERKYHYILDVNRIYDLLYRGICISRAHNDLKTPVRTVIDIKVAIENLPLGETNSGAYISREDAKAICFHEGLMTINYETGSLLGDRLNARSTLVISVFNRKLSTVCLEELNKHDDDNHFWACARYVIDNRGEQYPDIGLNDFKTLETDSEYYFHPRHSENPEDHYRFIYSMTMHNEDMTKILQDLFHRVFGKDILPQEYYDKRELFDEVHHELLLSPHLPTWYENEYTRTGKHFRGIAEGQKA